MGGALMPNPGSGEEDAKYRLSWSTEGSADRNKIAILAALEPLLASDPTSTSLPSSFEPAKRRPQRILELASGFGVQILHIAAAHPEVIFQPTEADKRLVTEIDEEILAKGKAAHNIRKARVLDALEERDWEALTEALEEEVEGAKIGDERGERAVNAAESYGYDGVVINNLFHVAPVEVTDSVFAHLSPTATAGRKSSPALLDPRRGWIAVYGAFNENGRFTSEGNRAFDADLRSRDSRFGLRDVEWVASMAREHGFELERKKNMPMGNLWLLFRVKAS